MQYLKPCEFDFIPHWTIEDKKYVAAFFYKLKRYYYHIEFDEFVAYLCNNQPYFGANTLKLRFSSKPLVLAAKNKFSAQKTKKRGKRFGTYYIIY